MSQVPYVLAPILVCSAVLKSVLIVPSKNAKKEVETSDQMGMAKYVWIPELALAAGTIFYASKDVLGRSIVMGLLCCTFAIFTLMCIRDLSRSKTQPCFCFGNLSRKAPRPFSCLRNGFLFLLSIAAFFSEPKSLTIAGAIASLILLGAILYEEIR